MKHDQSVIVDYKIVSMLADYSRELFLLKKDLWTKSRKDYNRIKRLIPKIDSIRERTKHWVMSDKEVYPYRAVETAEEIKSIANGIIDAGVSELYKAEMKDLIDKLDTVIVLIKLSDHKTSAWV